MRKVFTIWVSILLALVFGYFLYSVMGKGKKPVAVKNNPVAENYLITPFNKIA
jgi:hypothetical protein